MIGYWSGLINARQSDVDYNPSVQYEGLSKVPLHYVDIASMSQNAKSSAAEMRAAHYFYEKSKLPNEIKFHPIGPGLTRPLYGWEQPNVLRLSGATSASSSTVLGSFAWPQPNVWKMPISGSTPSFGPGPSSQAPVASQSTAASRSSAPVGFAPFSTSSPFAFGVKPSTSVAATPLPFPMSSKSMPERIVIAPGGPVGQSSQADGPPTPVNHRYRDNIPSPALSTLSIATIATGVVPSEWKDAEKVWEAARKVLEVKEEALAQAKEDFRIAAEDEKAKFIAYRMMRESED